MKKISKIVSILISAIMLIQALAITSFAEDVNTFPPQRPAVGNMKIITGECAEGGEVVVGLRTNGTVNIRAQELDDWGTGFSSSLKKELLSLDNVVDIACTKNIVVALKSDGTVVAAGNNAYGQCDYRDDLAGDWLLHGNVYGIDVCSF